MTTCCALGFAACGDDSEKEDPVPVETVSQIVQQYGAQVKNFFVNEVIEKTLPAETSFAAENMLGATVDLGDPQATELQSVKIVLFYATNAVDRVYSVKEITFTEPVALSAIAGYNSNSTNSVNTTVTELYVDDMNILDYAYNSNSLADAILEKVVQSDENPVQLTLKYVGQLYITLGETMKVSLCNKYELFYQTEKTVKKYNLAIRQQDSEEEIIESLNDEKNYKLLETEEITTLQTPLIISDYRQEDESDIPAAGNFMTFEPYGNGYAVTNLDERYRGSEIEIPASYNGMPVVCVGYNAFNGCSLLTSVSIPDSVTEIEDYAFHRCSSLTSVSIGSGITSIAINAFYLCDSLAEIHISDIAAWCGIDFADTLLYGVKLYFNNKPVTDLVIPEGVTSISDYAFAGCTSMTSVTIPDSVTSIGRDAFSDCPIETATIPSFAIDFIPASSLKTVVITSGETISDYAFSGCRSLTDVTIPDSVTSIGKSAFKNCSALKSISIPENVKSIGESAFEGCEALEGVYITNLAAWCGITFSTNDDNSTWSDVWANPLYFAKKLYLNGDLVTDLVIPDGVTIINPRAFMDCDFTSITIPNSVTSIAGNNFGTMFKKAAVPTHILKNILHVDLETVVITGGDTISDYAFSGCIGLTEVTLPDSVTSIGEYAFEDCTSLTSITLPDSVTTISVNAFTGCLLEEAKIPAIAIPAMPKSSVRNIEVTSGEIAQNAFNKFNALSSVKISGTVEKMETGAFKSCYSLRNVTIGGLITAIPNQAFAYCSALSYVSISDNVEIISYAAFSGCVALESVRIGSGIKEIYLEAFNNCTKLINITYNGTKAEWNAVQKNVGIQGTYIMNWDTDTGKYTIHCTDGDIAKS